MQERDGRQGAREMEACTGRAEREKGRIRKRAVCRERIQAKQYVDAAGVSISIYVGGVCCCAVGVCEVGDNQKTKELRLYMMVRTRRIRYAWAASKA